MNDEYFDTKKEDSYVLNIRLLCEKSIYHSLVVALLCDRKSFFAGDCRNRFKSSEKSFEGRVVGA